MRAERIRREICKREAEDSFIEFAKQAWPVAENIEAAQWNWHLDAIAEHLEALYHGYMETEGKPQLPGDLTINVPPSTGKTTLANVLFPVWCWLKNPRMTIICVSYADRLSNRSSTKRRDLMRSDWFQDNWKDVFQFAADENRKTHYKNNHGGEIIATSVTGSITGMHADLIICDDLIDPRRAASAAMIAQCEYWWKETRPTRFKNKAKGKTLLIMQRLHEADPTGLQLDKGNPKHCLLRLPMEYEAEEPCETMLGWKDPRTEEGELLFPARLDRETIEDLKEDLGPFGTASQLQQRPTPEGGGMIEWSWFGQYRREGNILHYRDTAVDITKCYVWVGADVATTKKATSDYSCLMLWATPFNTRLMLLLDLFMVRYEMPELIDLGKEILMNRYAQMMYAESNGVGTPFIQGLQREGLRVQGIQSVSDKVTRLKMAQPSLSRGEVLLPENAAWLADFRKETSLFPYVKHDDQVDALSLSVLVQSDGKLNPPTSAHVAVTGTPRINDLGAPLVGVPPPEKRNARSKRSRPERPKW